uniref:Uncharacterized protein n=1 Tax=Onchocerca volvulus TaxID=6282 RepID=A0A8R1TQW7_ONCVO
MSQDEQICEITKNKILKLLKAVVTSENNWKEYQNNQKTHHLQLAKSNPSFLEHTFTAAEKILICLLICKEILLLLKFYLQKS